MANTADSLLIRSHKITTYKYLVGIKETDLQRSGNKAGIVKEREEYKLSIQQLRTIQKPCIVIMRPIEKRPTSVTTITLQQAKSSPGEVWITPTQLFAQWLLW